MQIVALSSLNWLGRYVVGELGQRFAVQAVFQVQSLPLARRKSRVRQMFSSDVLRPLERRWVQHPREQRMDAELRRRLFGGVVPVLPNLIEVPPGEHNSVATADRLRGYSPDVLVVCCAPLLQPRIFQIPRLATINVHFGIAPDYRGDQTLFWPVYFRDYTNLGVTIHIIDAGIDTGPILSRGYVSVLPDDDEFSLHEKAGRLAARLLPEVVGTLPDRLASLPRPTATPRGRQFSGRARRAWHDAVVWARRRWGERPPVLPERIQDSPAA